MGIGTMVVKLKPKGRKGAPRKPPGLEGVVLESEKPVVVVVNGQKRVDWSNAAHQFISSSCAISVREWARRWNLDEDYVGQKARAGGWHAQRAAFNLAVSAIERRGLVLAIRAAIGHYGDTAVQGAEKVKELLDRVDTAEGLQRTMSGAWKGLKLALLALEYLESEEMPIPIEVEMVKTQKLELAG